MESAVTKPLEEALNTISGIDELRSITREGNSTLVIRFVLEKDGDVGAQEARDKISSVIRQLPEGMETPLVNKFDLDAAPIITIGVSGGATFARSPRLPSIRSKSCCKRYQVWETFSSRVAAAVPSMSA